MLVNKTQNEIEQKIISQTFIKSGEKPSNKNFL